MSFSITKSDQICQTDMSLLMVRYDPSKKLIAASSEDGCVYFLNHKSALLGRCKLSDCDVTSIYFGGEDNLFASSSKFVYEIDLTTYKKTSRYKQKDKTSF